MTKEVIRRKSGKRDALLAAASRLCFEKGIHPVTVEEIAQTAGTSKATFYKYFADKSAIVEAILAQAADSIMEQLQTLVQKAKQERMSKEDFLRIFDVEEYDQFFRGHFVDDLMNGYPQVVSSFMESYIGKVLPLYRDLIRSAKIDGIVRLDVDTEVLLAYTIILRRAVAQEQLRPPPGMETKDYSAKFWDLYLYGIMGKREESLS
ncbi:MAG: transcriptional regulator, TetR family [Paenibacillaceae bacterium]|jgi:AcrR family transcriptional regulator|nr:transcriptional regulator, TetR family [Paenibacillaceae bacterium]